MGLETCLEIIIAQLLSLDLLGQGAPALVWGGVPCQLHIAVLQRGRGEEWWRLIIRRGICCAVPGLPLSKALLLWDKAQIQPAQSMRPKIILLCCEAAVERDCGRP